MDGRKYVMRICVVGVGNIGMRYVQGIRKTFPEAKLVLIDCDARLKELAQLGLSNILLLPCLDDIEVPIDLFVVSTSCESRLSIYKRCLELNPKYIILEKYLFKSRAEYKECLSMPRVPTFVNQWMYGSKAFDCLFDNNDAQSVELRGSGWGLACNSVHWMDVFKRHMNITHLNVGSGTFISEVFSSKRIGYEEIYGELVFKDRDSDKSFKLIDVPDPSLINMQKITVDGKAYTFDYSKIMIGEDVLSHFPYFSELIGGIVGKILEHGHCHLPLIEESISQHLLMEDILDTLSHRPKVT
jgi:hypothetical protein